MGGFSYLCIMPKYNHINKLKTIKFVQEFYLQKKQEAREKGMRIGNSEILKQLGEQYNIHISQSTLYHYINVGGIKGKIKKFNKTLQHPY